MGGERTAPLRADHDQGSATTQRDDDTAPAFGAVQVGFPIPMAGQVWGLAPAPMRNGDAPVAASGNRAIDRVGAGAASSATEPRGFLTAAGRDRRPLDTLRATQSRRATQEPPPLRWLPARPAGRRDVIRRKPVPVDTAKGVRPRYRDDTFDGFVLVREADFEPDEYQIKDLVTRVYWRQAEGAYFTSRDGGSEFDVAAFLKNKRFGAWLESYQEATAFEAATKGNDNKRTERIALDMHVLQQFFSNALFSAKEIERFDYQSSPLNFQDKHTYIRAAATPVVDVLRKKLTEKWGTGWESERVFLGQDQALQSVMTQVFNTIVITEDDLKKSSALLAKFEPLARSIVDYVFARREKKSTEFDVARVEDLKAAQVDLKDKESQRAQLEKTIKVRPLTPTAQERVLIDLLSAEDQLRTAIEKAAKLDLKRLDGSIKKLEEDLAKALEEEKKTTSPTAPTGTPSASVQPVPKQKASASSGLQRALETKRQEREKAVVNAAALTKEIEALEQQLGVSGTAAMDPPARATALERSRAGRIEELEKAATGSAFIKAVKDQPGVERDVARLKVEIKTIESRRFVLLRNYEKEGSLTFVDFTRMFQGKPADDVRAAFEGGMTSGPGAEVAAALYAEVTRQTVERFVDQEFSAADSSVKGQLVVEIMAFVKDLDDKRKAQQQQAVLAKAPNVKSAKSGKGTNTGGQPQSSAQTIPNLPPSVPDDQAYPMLAKEAKKKSVADLIKPLTDVLDEITKKSSNTTIGLDKLFVSGGVLTLDDRQGGYRQPALLVSHGALNDQITSAIGKSGLVPTPTDAARKLLVHDVPLPEIVAEIIKIQRDRENIEAPTLVKLDQILDRVSNFRPEKFTGIAAVKDHFKATKNAFGAFVEMSKGVHDQVRLLAPPVARMIECLGILDEPGQQSAPSTFPAFALAQLRQNLDAAVANQHDLVEFVRNIQNLHEMIIYALELGMQPKQVDRLPTPPDAQQVHVTHYGLTAFTQTYNAVLAQHKEHHPGSGAPALSVAAFHDIYFEMMQKIGHTAHASNKTVKVEKPTDVMGLLSKHIKPGLTVQQPEVDLIAVDIHPNDASQIAIHKQNVIELISELFDGSAPDFRCTIMVDITLNHVADAEIAGITSAAKKHIDSGKLNLVFTQSLTKFAQLGSDKHSGGLMFHYNKASDWKAFNAYVAEAMDRDRVDPTIKSYFELLFATSKKEQIDYIAKVRANTRMVYDQLKDAFASLGVQNKVLELADNDDPGACYVAFHYKPFAAAVFGNDASGELIRNMAKEVLFDVIDKLAGKLKLPLNMRTSFGFPLSNLGDIDPGIRLTVGIEDPELLRQYVQLMTVVNGKISKEMSDEGRQTLSDPGTRKQFLAGIVGEINDLDQLDKAFTAQQGEKKAPPLWRPASIISAQPNNATIAPITSVTGQSPTAQDDPTVGIGRVQHIENSCYAASLLTLFATTPAYRNLLDTKSHPLQGQGSSNVVTTGTQAKTDEPQTPSIAELDLKRGETIQASKLGELADALRNPDALVTGQQVKELLQLFLKLGILVPPYQGEHVSISYQQDASEILQALLDLLNPGDDLVVVEQRLVIDKKDQGASPMAKPQRQPILHLEIDEKARSIPDALRHYCRVEELENTGGTFSKMVFAKLPRVLTISLVRFKRHPGYTEKITDRVDSPELLVIPEECLDPGLRDAKWIYQLKSFVRHKGYVQSGHYTAYGRDEKDEWYHSDDIGGRSRPEPTDLKKAREKAYIYTYELVG